MALRTAARLGVDASVRAARLPFDVGTRLVGGPQSPVALAVDRADARARALAGFVLGDADLRDDAERRHAATDERVRALRLRERADDVSERADERLARKERTADHRRAGAVSGAQQRKAQAEKRHQAREAAVTESAEQRQRATEQARVAAQQTVEARADETRLEAVEERAEALEQQQDALIARDEAKRLGGAAARAKEQRKR